MKSRRMIDGLSPRNRAEVMLQLGKAKPNGFAHKGAVRAINKQFIGYISPLFFTLHNVPQPIAEYRFDVSRKWRFDYAWPEKKIALEVEGGVWTNGRHTRGRGFIEDMEKYNRAAVLGWRVIRATPTTAATTETASMLRDVLA